MRRREEDEGSDKEMRGAEDQREKEGREQQSIRGGDRMSACHISRTDQHQGLQSSHATLH